jgi:hypothetical protein
MPASVFASRAVAASTSIDPSVDFIITGGYAAAGDGGGARYYRFTGTSPGGFQSADGAWWALDEVEPNVLQFGANNQFNSGVDSSAAFQALIDFVSYQPPGGAIDRGGVAVVPAGSYYVGTGLTMPNPDVTVHLRGAGKSATFIDATANIDLLTINGPCKVSDIFFAGWNSVQNAANTLQINAANVTLEDVIVNYGQAGIQIGPSAGNAKFHRVGVSYCLNQSAHFLSTVNCVDCDFDTDWPALTTPPYGTTISPWSANATVSVGEVVTLVQNGLTLYLQCVTAGTTGSAQPNVPGYATDITDGTAVWQLALTANTVGVLLDGTNTFAATQCEFTNCDFTIAAQHGLFMQNVSGSVVPRILNLTECSFAGCLQAGVFLGAGDYAMISDCQFSGTSLSGTSALDISSGWSGPTIVEGCSFFGNSAVSIESNNAIQLRGGANTVISGNYFGQQASYAIDVVAGVSSFVISGNTFSNSAGAVEVESGSSNFYNIVNNIVNGAAVTDHGSGTQKEIANNF